MALQLAIFAVFLGALLEQLWLIAFTAIVVILLSFMPALIGHKLRIQLPVELTFVNCLFLYASFALGEVKQFYERFWWWDILLHSVSALLMGLTGFLMVYIFHASKRLKISPLLVAVFSFGFAVTIGTVWEIFEFIMDWFFGFEMQLNDLTDTMTDLIVDSVGALVASWIGYHYVKNGDSLLAERMVRRFIDKNPQWVKKLNHLRRKPKLKHK